MRAVLTIGVLLMAIMAVAADVPVTTRTLVDTEVAFIRFSGQYTDVGMFTEELMKAVGDKAAGPFMALYYDGPEVQVHDMEVCVGVTKKVEKGKVKTRTMKGGIYARTLHLGPYEGIGDTWMRLMSSVPPDQIADGPGLEIYLAWDPADPANYVTEVMLPIKQPLAIALAEAAPSNRIVHFEIPADDTARAVAFYTKAFGWKTQKWEEMDYWLCFTGVGLGIDGAIYKRTTKEDGTRNSLMVANLDDAVKAVEAAGGKITVPKAAITGVGWLVYAMDTEGNIFGMMQSDPTAK